MNEVRERHLPDEADPYRGEDLGLLYELAHDPCIITIAIAIVLLVALALPR